MSQRTFPLCQNQDKGKATMRKVRKDRDTRNIAVNYDTNRYVVLLSIPKYYGVLDCADYSVYVECTDDLGNKFFRQEPNDCDTAQKVIAQALCDLTKEKEP